MIELKTKNRKSTSITDTQIQWFAAKLNGALIQRDAPEYDDARAVWNGMIDKQPALIAQCVSTPDVVAAVNFAREHELLVAVRGGGHHVAGYAVCDDGLVIDLSRMNAVEVDPDTRIARAGGGAAIADLDAATQPHGLAAPMGVVSQTGIAGLTLGGGYGWLRNKYGLSCDNLIAAEVVTADGNVLLASETENNDLLWGLRGGGGNFGVVTMFEYQLHPVGPEVMFVFVLHNGADDNLKRGIQFYRDYCANAPDEVSTLGTFGVVPPDDMFPQEIHGKPFVGYVGMYAGSVGEGRKAMQPLIDFDEPMFNLSGVMPYVEAQQAYDEDCPDGMRYYWKSINLDTLNDQAIDRIVEHARQQPSVLSTTDLWHIGGEVKRGDPNESAFFGRDAAFLLNPEANWEKPENDEANIQWVREFIAAMEPFSDGSRYLNFPGFLEESDIAQKSFGPQYELLAALKTKYDPDNLFQINHNIQPAETS
jgi:hypothetical protein